jgi:hypothetical protein
MKDADFRQRFRQSTVEELIDTFNREVGSRAWVRSRGDMLIALREALLATGLDCSTFINDEGMSLATSIVREGSRTFMSGSPDKVDRHRTITPDRENQPPSIILQPGPGAGPQPGAL